MEDIQPTYTRKLFLQLHRMACSDELMKDILRSSIPIYIPGYNKYNVPPLA